MSASGCAQNYLHLGNVELIETELKPKPHQLSQIRCSPASFFLHFQCRRDAQYIPTRFKFHVSCMPGEGSILQGLQHMPRKRKVQISLLHEGI